MIEYREREVQTAIAIITNEVSYVLRRNEKTCGPGIGIFPTPENLRALDILIGVAREYKDPNILHRKFVSPSEEP